MRIGFVVCDECGWVGRGDIYDDGTVRPIGVATCPQCDGSNWREFLEE